MRIGIVGFASVGGSGFIAAALARELCKRDHQVHLFSSATPFPLRDAREPNLMIHVVECEQHPAFVHPAHTGHLAKILNETIRRGRVDLVHRHPVFRHPDYAGHLANKLIEVVRRERIDLVHVHAALPHAVSALAAKQVTGVPYVVTLHGHDVHTFGDKPEFKPVLKEAVAGADAVTAVCDFLGRRASRIWGIGKVRTIRNFVDYDDCGPTEPKPRLGHPALVHVSNFRPEKRIGDLVEGMAQILGALPSAKLHLIGEGPELPKLREQIAMRNLEDAVHCWGFQEDLAPFYAAADLFVLSSDIEGAPLTFLEAMYHGVPVVASRVGGVPEIVEDGVTGYTFRKGDITEYAAKVTAALSDPRHYQALRANARKLVLRDHAPAAILPCYESIYDEVIQ